MLICAEWFKHAFLAEIHWRLSVAAAEEISGGIFDGIFKIILYYWGHFLGIPIVNNKKIPSVFWRNHC